MHSKNLLSRKNVRTLWATLSHKAVLVFDYDGTLAPIAEDPDRAKMRKTTQHRLRLLAKQYPVYILTGRETQDAKRHLPIRALKGVIGNHGLDWPGALNRREARRRVTRWKAALTPIFSKIPGVWLEGKKISLSVHFAPTAAATVIKHLAKLEVPRKIPGRNVMNLLPSRRFDKGSAVRKILKKGSYRSFLFVGDDATDEAVYRGKYSVPSVQVHVANSQSSAPYGLKNQKEIDRLLDELLAMARRRGRNLHNLSRGVRLSK